MNKSQKKTATAVGASVAALAAATAAGMYFFGGKAGAKNRKKVASWAEKAKKQVMAEVEAMEKVSKKTYNEAVDAVTKQYKGVKNIKPEELQALAGELKSHWDSIVSEVTKASQKITATKKKAAPKKKAPVKKSPSKKPVKKATKKK